MSPWRICLDAGCSTLTRRTRCDEHERSLQLKRWADKPIARAVVEAAPWCVCRGSVDGCSRIHPGGQCNADTDLTADHALALANGGRNDGERRVLCRSCNSSRGKR